MGVHRFEESICWQLSVALKLRIYRVLARPEAARPARSAPALIAEGFGRWTRPEFIRYLRLANGELNETRDQVMDGADAQLIEPKELQVLVHLCYRATRACEGLIVSLLRKTNEEKKRKRGRRKDNQT